MLLNLRTTRKNERTMSIIERFAKLQNTLGAAMRHACILSGEPTDSFLKILAFYEKAGVLESVESWQLCRMARNLAAHDYDIDYAEIAEHFNSLKTLTPMLYMTAARFHKYCKEVLYIEATQTDFTTEFLQIINAE